MQGVSEAYLETVACKSRDFRIRLYFPAIGDYITEKNIWTGQYTDVVDGNNILTMGNACSRKMELTVHSLTTVPVWRGAEFVAECGMKVEGEFVWLPWGTFWVTDMSTSNNHRTVKLTGYDRMYSLSKVKYKTDLTAPFHYRALLSEFLTKTGMVLSEESIARLPAEDDATYIIKSWPAGEFYCSDMAAHLAGMVGCNSRVSVADPGVLEFVWYTPTGTVVKDTLYQDGLEKLADSELKVELLVTGNNSEIVIENDDDLDDGELDFSGFDVVDAEDLPLLTFTYNAETLTASVALTDGCEGNEDAIVIPDSVSHEGVVYTVTSIPDNGFKYSAASRITLPNTIESIGASAFEECDNIAEFTIPESVKSLGPDVIGNCDSLVKVYLNAEDCAYYSYGSFAKLANETVFVIGNTVNAIQTACFYNATKVVAVNIPNSVTSIASGAFQKSGIKSITIPNSVSVIPDSAFSGCKSLKDITIGSGVTSIGTWAFDGCSSLVSVYIPDNVTQIKSYAFQNCTSMESLHIGSGVTEIAGNAFQNCTSLTNLTISDGVSVIGGWAFAGCTSLSSLFVPDSVTKIEANAFQKCTGLTSVQIGESDECAISSINQWYAPFSGCTAIQTITIYAAADSVAGSPWGATNASVIWMG